MAWTTNSGKERYYCYLTGGHVLLGYHLTEGPFLESHTPLGTCTVEQFLQGDPLSQKVKEGMGQQTYEDILDKANRFIERKNKKTSAPQGS